MSGREEKGPAIEVQGLSKSFGSFRAVDNVSFSVPRGAIFGLLGANGAGKSTTIRMLCGLLKSTSGGARVAGFDINSQSDALKSRIGYMSQRFSLYEDLTVAENIRFFGGVYGLEREALTRRADWVLDMAGLSGRQTSLTRELAQGFKQRLALGCAVLHEPQIVFLDEPTGGVDPVSRRRFWELIHAMAGKGTTVLVTTHYLDEAEYCSTITLMHAGRVIAQGSPGALKERHIASDMYEVECPNVIEGMEALQGEPWVRETSVFGTKLHVNVTQEGGHDAPGRIASLLEARGIPATAIQRIVPSLEDVFIQLIERQREEAGP